MSKKLMDSLMALTQELAKTSSSRRGSDQQAGREVDPGSSSGPAPLYRRASDREIAAAGGIRVDRANISIDVVPESVLAKIRNDEYVELAELIHKIPKVFNLVEGEGDLKVRSKESTPRLTILDWFVAFQMFANAYCVYFPSARNDLQLYMFFITKLMRVEGAKWQVYDEKFRKDRKMLRLGWGEYRQLLHTEVLTGATNGSSVSSPLRFSKSKASRPKERIRVCFRFNNEGCSREHCPYRHFCSSCHQSGHGRSSCKSGLSRKNQEKRK